MGFVSVIRGNASEKFAASYLKKYGYTVVAQNFHSKFGEIDIIAYDGDVLAFVEVKFRANTDFGQPSSYVDQRKQNKILKTALHYMYREKISDINIRFDVVELIKDRCRAGKYQASILKNAFDIGEI